MDIELVRKTLFKNTWIFNLFCSRMMQTFRGNIQKMFIVPYYHMVNDGEVLHIKHLYRHKSVKQFKEDLDYLLKRYKVISLFDLIKIYKNRCPVPQNSFLLTFDDGFREMYDIVYPILLEKGIPATFFINSDFSDNNEMCYLHKASILAEYITDDLSFRIIGKIREMLNENDIHCEDIKRGVLLIQYQQRKIIDQMAQLIDLDLKEYLARNKPYLTSKQIENLIKYGFTIGGHSIDHPLYSSLSLNEQLLQTIESVNFLKRRFGLTYGAFAFPHGDYMVSEEFFRRLFTNGLVDVCFGTGGMVEDEYPGNFQRISFEKPLIPAERILAVQFTRRIWNKSWIKGKRSRKRF